MQFAWLMSITLLGITAVDCLYKPWLELGTTKLELFESPSAKTAGPRAICPYCGARFPYRDSDIGVEGTAPCRKCGQLIDDHIITLASLGECNQILSMVREFVRTRAMSAASGLANQQ